MFRTFAHKQDSHLQAVPGQEEREKARRAPWHAHRPPRPRWTRPQSGQACASVFSFPAVASAGQRPPPLSPAPRPAVTGLAVAAGCCLCVGKPEMPVSSTAGARVSVRRASARPVHSAHRGHGHGHRPASSECQDATGWGDAEDFPFLWFFCLF